MTIKFSYIRLSKFAKPDECILVNTLENGIALLSDYEQVNTMMEIMTKMRTSSDRYKYYTSRAQFSIRFQEEWTTSSPPLFAEVHRASKGIKSVEKN